MITRETAARIWNAYREIEVGEKLLATMEEMKEKHRLDPNDATLEDAFGRRQHLQLGLPMGQGGSRLLEVHPRLAVSIIRAHIQNKRTELVEANEAARLELEGDIAATARTVGGGE